MAEEAEDQQIEAYIGALDEDWTEEGEEEETEDDVVLTSEALEALADVDAVTKHVFQGDTNGDDANETNGTIIMDADGNYYFHTSEKTIEVKPLKFNDSSKLIKIQSATVIKKGVKGFKADELAKHSKAAAKKNGNQIKVNGNIIAGDQKSTTDEINTNQTDLNAYELIIPETEAEFYALNKTSTNEVDQQDTTNATDAAIHTMTVYDCKNCTFKTNSADLLENHLETCEKIKEEKKQETAALVKPKVGRPSKKYSSSKNKEKSKITTSSKKKEKQHDEYMQDEYEVNDPDYNPENEVEVRSEALMKSITSDAPSEEFKCPHCPYVAPKKFSLSRHLKTHSDDRPYKCSICEKGFKTAASLQNHVNTHLGNKPHVCGDCGKSFTTSGELVRHSRYRHTGIRPHKCTECDYASVEMSKLKRHMRCHTGERPYQCPHCTYASPDSFKLKRHMRTHTGEKPYECDICHARFTQSNSLKYHRLIHSVNEKPVFQCPMCPTTCGRKTDLRLHIQNLHSTDKAWPCNRCGKELPDRYSYKMHIKSHEGEKCFQCKYCPYASVLQRHLTIHMLLHTDEKPFKCDTCDMPFRQKMLLQRHINVYHTGEYVPPKPREKSHACPHCEKTFCFKGNLIRHMEIHDPTSAVEQRQFELKLGRLIRVSDEKNKMNEDAEVAANDGGDYNEADDDEAAIVESLVDHNELEYHNEVADDENDEEEEAYYLYEEIEEDEKPSLMNSLECENKSISSIKPTTKQTIDKVKTEKEQLNNVKVEKETSDNVVVIEIMQCADDTLMEVEEETNLMETSEVGEEKENHKKKKLNTLEIIDNTKNNTVIFEEEANVELMDDEQRIEFFEITEAN